MEHAWPYCWIGCKESIYKIQTLINSNCDDNCLQMNCLIIPVHYKTLKPLSWHFSCMSSFFTYLTYSSSHGHVSTVGHTQSSLQLKAPMLPHLVILMLPSHIVSCLANSCMVGLPCCGSHCMAWDTILLLSLHTAYLNHLTHLSWSMPANFCRHVCSRTILHFTPPACLCNLWYVAYSHLRLIGLYKINKLHR